MKLKDIIKGVKDGTITILESGHQCNPLLDKLEYTYEHTLKIIQEYKDKIKNGEEENDGVKCERMIDLFESKLEAKIGQSIADMEQYCFNCDANMYVKMLDEKTIGYVPTGKYWDIAEKSGTKYGFKISKKDIPECECKHLTKAQKLTTTINVPSGKLIFQNFFRSEKLSDPDDYSKPGLNSILGRNEIMQDLAKRNVGYGQMGNMSVEIYANKEEIIIGNCEDGYLDNEYYYEQHPEKIDDDWKEETKNYKKFKSRLDKGKFKHLGSISLGVWRWMCTDETFYKENNEKQGEYDDQVIVKVKKGTYEINHYYDFPRNGDYIYSTLKFKK